MADNNPQKTQQPSISIVTDYVPYVPAGKDRLDVALTVKSSGFDLAGYSRKRWNGIVIDHSGSMQGERMIRAVEAAQVAVDQVNEDDYICVIAFNDRPQTIFPSARASTVNKAKAKKAIAGVIATGGTVFSDSLLAAFKEFEDCPDCDGTVVFLSDGDNKEPRDRFNKEKRDPFSHALELLTQKRAEGVTFKVQCRCVGTDPTSMADLHAIASATLGNSPVAIADPAHLAADFKAIFQAAQSNVMSGVELVIYTPKVVTVGSVKQISPTINDLTGELRYDPATQNHEIRLGAWSNEERTFYVSFQVPPKDVGGQITCGRIMIRYRYGGQEHIEPVGGEVIKANWTVVDDPRSQRVSAGVAMAKGTVAAVPLLQEAVTAYRNGQRDVATQKLGQVAKIASENNDTDLLALVTQMAHVDNASAGMVTLKAVNKEVTMKVEGASTQRAITVKARPAGSE